MNIQYLFHLSHIFQRVNLSHDRRRWDRMQQKMQDVYFNEKQTKSYKNVFYGEEMFLLAGGRTAYRSAFRCLFTTTCTMFRSEQIFHQRERCRQIFTANNVGDTQRGGGHPPRRILRISRSSSLQSRSGLKYKTRRFELNKNNNLKKKQKNKHKMEERLKSSLIWFV